MSPLFDVFVSYSRADREKVDLFVTGLESAGLRIWMDRSEIPVFSDVDQKIGEGLAQSRLFVAIYSRAYADSVACQKELIAAYLAAQLCQQRPATRIVVVNLEGGSFSHIPQSLRGLQIPSLDGLTEGEVIAGLREKLGGVPGPIGQRDWAIRITGNIAPSSTFVGRSRELWDLHEKLTQNRLGFISGKFGGDTVQLRGLGGIGKSLLAHEYWLRYAASYPGGLFELRATDNANRDQQLATCAARLEIDTSNLTQIQIENRFWQRIEDGEPCLWLVDDLPAGLKMDEVKQWFAKASKATTLVTTRSLSYGTVGSRLDLGALSEADAYKLLTRQRAPEGEDEESSARELCRELGYHPLALEVAGSYLAQGSQRFGAYLRELRSGSEDALEWGAGIEEELPTGHERSIQGTFWKSIAQLPAASLDFLRIASLLLPSPIETGLIEQVLEAASGEEGTGPKLFVQAVSPAALLGLCTGVGTDTREVHALISRTIRFRYGSDERTGALRSALVRTLISRLAAVDAIQDLHQITRFSRDLQHARHLLARGVESEDEAVMALLVSQHEMVRGTSAASLDLLESAVAFATSTFGPAHENTRFAITTFASALTQSGQLTKAKDLNQQMLASALEPTGEEDGSLLSAFSSLALTLGEQGNYESAIRIQRRVLKTYQSRFGEDSFEALLEGNNLATSLYVMGQMSEAKELLEKAAKGIRPVLGDEHPQTNRCLSNLGLCQYGLGNQIEARRILEPLLSRQREVLGDENIDTARTMNNLALVLRAVGDLRGAQTLLETSAPILQRLVGEEHPLVARTLLNLCAVLFENGESEKAQRWLQSALESRDRIGSDNLDSLAVAGLAAQMLFSQGQPETGYAMQEEVVAKLQTLFGETHPYALTQSLMLAAMLQQRGERDRARQIVTDTERKATETLGEDHQITLDAVESQVELAAAQGDYPRAAELLETLLARRARISGEEHPAFFDIQAKIAQVRSLAGDLPGARKLQEQVVAAQTRVSGKEHPNTLDAKQSLAQIMYRQADFSEAAAFQEELLKVRSRMSGADSPGAILAKNDLGLTLVALGDNDRAKELLEQASADASRILGPMHGETTKVRNNLAQAYYARGDYEAANRLAEAAYKEAQVRLGPEHPDTLLFMNNYAQTLSMQGEVDSALELIGEAYEKSRLILPKDHPTALLIAVNYMQAQILQQQAGTMDEVEGLIEACDRTLGEDHPVSMEAVKTKILLLAVLDDREAADAFANESPRARTILQSFAAGAS